MRGKSNPNFLSSPIPERPLITRRSRTRKDLGELAELAFFHKATSLGFGVAKPYGDSERYDFILDSGERFWRVQVKSVYGSSRFHARSGYGDQAVYTAKEIDFLVVYVVRHNAWYVIPVESLPASGALNFYPAGSRRGAGRFECYREAWYLMAPGAGLPRPGILRCVRAIYVGREKRGSCEKPG